MREFAVEHGLEDVPDPMSGAMAERNIVLVPREFQPNGTRFDERFFFVGPSLGLRGKADEWRPADPGARLVYISLGTAFNERPEFFRACLDAFRDGRWQVAMSVGDRVRPDELGDIPPNVEVRSHFPQLSVLRHADAFVTHAGMNSTMEALYREVPLVTVPQMPEQEANSRRVRDLGLGREVDGSTVTAEQLRRAVDEVSADTGIRARLAEIGRTVREAGGAVLGADALEKHLADAGG